MSKYASENSQIMSFYNLSQSDCQKKTYKIEENIRKQQKEHFDLIVYYLVMPILILVVGRLCMVCHFSVVSSFHLSNL